MSLNFTSGHFFGGGWQGGRPICTLKGVSSSRSSCRRKTQCHSCAVQKEGEIKKSDAIISYPWDAPTLTSLRTLKQRMKRRIFAATTYHHPEVRVRFIRSDSLSHRATKINHCPFSVELLNFGRVKTNRLMRVQLPWWLPSHVSINFWSPDITRSPDRLQNLRGLGCFFQKLV